MPRLCIVPRWGGGPERDFYPWLRAALQAEQPPRFSQILSPDMPNPSTPTIAAWVGHLDSVLPAADAAQRAVLGQTVLMGHSVGCQAAMRYLAGLPEGVTLAGAVYVAGWLSVDRPWDSILPWMHTPIDFAAARAHAHQHILLLSDNDPFTADHARTAAAFREQLGATVVLAPGRRHFNETAEPAVLDLLREHF